MKIVSSVALSPTPVKKRPRNWNKAVRLIHLYSSIGMLVIMLFFTITGITLNHREWLPKPAPESELNTPLPAPLAESTLWQEDPIGSAQKVLQHLSQTHDVSGAQTLFDWDAESQWMAIDIKRPGGYRSIEISLEEQSIVLLNQDYGLMRLLNDLHMGRSTNAWWRGFIDASAVLMLLFTLSGLWLAVPQKRRHHLLIGIASLGTGAMALAYLLTLQP